MILMIQAGTKSHIARKGWEGDISSLMLFSNLLPTDHITKINVTDADKLMTYRGNVPKKDWNDWRWQEKNAIHSLEELKVILDLPHDFLLQEIVGKLPDKDFFMKITPHYMNQLLKLKSESGLPRIVPLLRTLLPVAEEDKDSFDVVDGMGEEGTGEHKLISNLYEDRGLLFVTNRCPVHCRYCFRRRKINDDEHVVRRAEIFEAINRIKANPNIRDVIISGGDPLTLADSVLDEILDSLYKINHVAIVRIDTKFATALPQRFTEDLLIVLQKRKPLYMTLHFVHPDEISSETEGVCNKLADSGIVLGSYIPLLKGINDDREILKSLFLKLAQMRVRPYYLVQNVTNKWNRHFQVPIEEGLKIIDGLHGEISGVALPTYVVYLPEAGGKVPLQPNYITKRTKEGYIIRNFQNREILYRDPL